jgi:hypothetical protein
MKILIPIILLSVLFLTACSSINVSQIEHSDLYEYTLQQKEFKAHLGDQEIDTYSVSPVRSFTKEGNTFSPEIYTLFANEKPSCLEKVELGEVIRRVQINTPNRNIEAIYSAETNKLVCVLSYDKSKYQ